MPDATATIFCSSASLNSASLLISFLIICHGVALWYSVTPRVSLLCHNSSDDHIVTGIVTIFLGTVESEGKNSPEFFGTDEPPEKTRTPETAYRGYNIHAVDDRVDRFLGQKLSRNF